VSLGFFAGIFAVNFYVADIFPNISRQWGGGSPERAELWGAPGSAEVLRRALRITQSDGPFLVCLVDETSDTYLVRSASNAACDDTVITIPRSAVVAIVPLR